MGGWLPTALLALAVAAALFPFARRDKGALQFLAAALLLALAGYAWQGRPDQPGSPKAPPGDLQLADDDFTTLRPDLLGRFDRAAFWNTLADSYRRRGDMHGAAVILETAVERNPGNFSLWIAYGYGLVANGGDMMSPASQLAFQRAAQLAPQHPGPQFFYGLALARGGNYEEAERVWSELLPGVPADSLYHSAIVERIAAVRLALSTGAPLAPAPVPTPARPAAP